MTLGADVWGGTGTLNGMQDELKFVTEIIWTLECIISTVPQLKYLHFKFTKEHVIGQQETGDIQILDL